jgi:hypothetical protein
MLLVQSDFAEITSIVAETTIGVISASSQRKLAIKYISLHDIDGYVQIKKDQRTK